MGGAHSREVQEALPMTRQHVVSQVVLRRFADGENQLSVFDRLVGRVVRKGPAGVAYVENLVAHEPESSEHLWKTVEDRVPELFRSLESGQLPIDGRVVDLGKDLIALHWARSHTLLAIWNDLIPKKLNLLTERLLTNFTPEEAFLSLTGFYPPDGDASRAYVVDYIAEHWEQQFSDGTLFRERLEFNYQKARDLASSLSLQVAEAVEGQFVIGDNPALTVHLDSRRVGPLQGVYWDLADAILMPLDPRFCLGLGAEPGWIKCNKSQVLKLNSVQVAGFVRHLVLPQGCH